MPVTIAVTAVLLVAPGCGSRPVTRGAAITRVVAPAPGDPGPTSPLLVAARAAAEAAWARRLDEAQLRAAIASWQEVVAAKDDDVAAYTMLSRASFFLADGFLQLDPARRSDAPAVHEAGAAWAERGLRALSPDFERRRRAGEEVDQAAAALGIQAVPLLYWYAQNLLRWAAATSFVTTVRQHPRIFRIIERVQVLDPGFYHAAPDRYFATVYAAAPAIAGGDLKKSRTFFERTLARAPNFLESHVLLAELYATRVKDRRLYEESLRYVLAMPADVIPDLVPEQTIEQRKATILLGQTAQKFPPGP